MYTLRQTILPVLVLAGSLTGTPYAVPQSTASPTLRETQDWLTPHLTGVVHSSRKTAVTIRTKKGKEPKEVDRQEVNLTESVTGAVFDGCTLTLTQLSKGDDYSVTTVSIVPLGQLTGISLKTETYDPVRTADGEDSTTTTTVPASATGILFEGSSGLITWKRKSTGSVPYEEARIPYEGRGASLTIRTDDAAMAERLVKAFDHAMSLCHVESKPEPF